MPSSRRLPVSAKKNGCATYGAPQFHYLCNPITKIRSISMSTLADASTDVKAGLEVVPVSLFVQMPHGA
jgi:hypothetical protein